MAPGGEALGVPDGGADCVTPPLPVTLTVLEEEGEERLRMLGTATPLTPEEWIETLVHPILARQQRRLAWVDYGMER